MRPSPIGTYLLQAGGLALAYATTAVLGLQLAVASGNATAVWLPSGIAVAAVLLGGVRLWPGIALGAFVATLSTEAPIVTAFGIALGNTLAAVIGVQLLSGAGFHPALARVRDVVALVVLAAFAGTSISATIGVGSLALGGLEASTLVWWTWWLGDAVGVLVAAPLVLSWVHPGEESGHAAGAAGERGLLALTASVASFVVFTMPMPHYYLLFPIAMWAATRFGSREVSAFALLVFAIAAWRTATGDGPFATDALVPALLGSQLLVGVLSLTGLLLAAAIAERRNAEDRMERTLGDLRRSRSTLRELTQRQAAIREQERSRLGFDLHDNICQELVGSGILVASIRQRLGVVPPEIGEEFDRVQRYIDALVEHLRRLAHELRPLQLRDLGLEESLRALANGLSSDGCRVVTTVETQVPRMEEEGEFGIYRIAQEAMTNAVRHAGATAIGVELGVASGMLTLQVTDDGHGFDPDAAMTSLGLTSMRERALALGGTLTIQSDPGAGTRVRLEVPCSDGGSGDAAASSGG